MADQTVNVFVTDLETISVTIEEISFDVSLEDYQDIVVEVMDAEPILLETSEEWFTVDMSPEIIYVNLTECVALSIPGGGTTLTVAEIDGAPSAEVTKIVFNGVDEIVTIEGTIAYINRPAYQYSKFNATDGTTDCIPDLVGTINYNVAIPTSEGNPYKIGNWSNGIVKPCTNGTVQLTTSAKARNLDGKTFQITVYDADDTTVLASHSIVMTGNADNTANGIQLQVTDWALDVDQYAANIQAIITPATIIGGSGRFRVKVEVTDSVAYFPLPVFYDANASTCTVLPPTFAEEARTTKFLSGVEFYTIGSQFSVNISDIDFPNQDTYLSSGIVNIIGSDLGLPALVLDTIDLTGWTNAHDASNCSYSKLDWAISQTNLFSMNATAGVSARGNDPWGSQNYQDSSTMAVLVNTYGEVSTQYYEDFRDEVWRLPSGDYDTILGTLATDWQDNWDSLADLTDGLQCWNSGGWKLYYPRLNYGLYGPSPSTQPDYSLMSGRLYYYRAFYHNTSNAVQGSLRLHGLSKTDLQIAVDAGLRVEFKIPGKTGWLDLGAEFSAGSYSGSTGDGIWQNKSAQTNDWFDFGWTSQDALDSSCGWTVIVRVSADSISVNLPTALTIQFDVQEWA